MDTLTIERNSKYETWYSADYIKQQIEIAYRSGMHKGARFEFHAIEPVSKESVENLVSEFKQRLNDEYQKSYVNGDVWR